MDLPQVVSRESWLAARRELLIEEKRLTRARDELAAQLRAQPMVLVDKDYVFTGPDGKLNLLDLFDGRRQLIVYHWMWPMEHIEWCPLCSFWIDNIGNLDHLNARDTTLVVDCPAPLEESLPFRERMGWTLPWVSSFDSDFFDDFHVEMDEPGVRERPGVSVFLREDDNVYHTHSTYRRGADVLNTTYNYLDLTPLGRQEPTTGFKQSWVRYHDEYETAGAADEACDC